MFHSLRLFAEQYPFVESDWYRHSNTIVLLEVDGRDELEELARRAREQRLTCAEFAEPLPDDVGLTALALGPDARRLVSSLPLALKEPEP